MTCDGDGGRGGGGNEEEEEMEIEISFSEVLLLNESAKQHTVVLQGDLHAEL